jgi:hypothetical protein
MRNPASHPGRALKAPTTAQLDALSAGTKHVLRREPYVCPLCEQIPDEIRLLVKKGNPTEPTEVYQFLTNHIAKHTKSLSLMP